MAKFTTTTISNYNQSPPPDDGSTGSDNLIQWSGIKTKLADSIKNYVDSIQNNVNTAFGNLYTNIEEHSSDLETAVNAIGSSETTLVIKSSTTVSNDVTVPSNITLMFLHGGDLTVSASKTVTLNSNPEAGLYQIFKGAGDVVAGASYVGEWWMEWFGAVGDDSTDNQTAIKNALDFGVLASGGTCRFGQGIYRTSKLLWVQKVIIRGVGAESSILDFTPSADYGIHVTGGVSNFMHGSGLFDLRLQNATDHNFYLDNTSGGGVGEAFSIDRVQSYSSGGDGFHFAGDSTPLRLGQLSPHGNTGAGIRFKGESQGHVQVLYAAGDANLESLITFEDVSNESSYNILGWKSERTAASLGHPNIFEIKNASGGYVGIGPGRYTAQNAAAGNAIVKITSGTSILLDLAPFSRAVGVVADYTYGVEDLIRTVTRTVDQVRLKKYSTVPDVRDQSFANEVVTFLNNFRHSIASSPTSNTLRINHSTDGAAATPNVEFYDGTTLIAKLSNGGTLNLAGNLRIGNVTSGPVLLQGTGTPEGAVTGNVGWVFLRTDGGAGTTLYVKESGTGNTGWVGK